MYSHFSVSGTWSGSSATLPSTKHLQNLLNVFFWWWTYVFRDKNKWLCIIWVWLFIGTIKDVTENVNNHSSFLLCCSTVVTLRKNILSKQQNIYILTVKWNSFWKTFSHILLLLRFLMLFWFALYSSGIETFIHRVQQLPSKVYYKWISIVFSFFLNTENRVEINVPWNHTCTMDTRSG